MKYLFLLTILLINCSHIRNNEYESILKSLEKNYTIQSNSKSPFLFCWKVDQSTFINDSLEYKNTLKLMYKQDISFIKYILKFKSQKNQYNNWVTTKNPCESNFKDKDFMSNYKSVIIIIDNLLLNKDNDTIIINDYVSYIKHEKLKKIVNNKNVKEEYLKYIKNL